METICKKCKGGIYEGEGCYCPNFTDKITLLEKAKENTSYLLQNATSLIDFKGLTYWASEVERFREVIKKI